MSFLTIVQKHRPGASYSALAKEFGFATTTISQWRFTRPTVETLWHVARVLKMKPGDLFEEYMTDSLNPQIDQKEIAQC